MAGQPRKEKKQAEKRRAAVGYDEGDRSLTGSSSCCSSKLCSPACSFCLAEPTSRVFFLSEVFICSSGFCFHWNFCYSKDGAVHGLSDTIVGVLGGGQLGRMLCQAASKMAIKVTVLDPEESCPASKLAHHHMVGSFDDSATVQQFAKRCGVLTVEIEHVDVETLEKLEQQGVDCQPKASTIRIIQMDDLEGAKRAGDRFDYPLMIKSKRLAYDGRGNAVAKSEEDLTSVVTALGGFDRGLYVEKWAPFIKELAVIVARGRDNSIVCYPWKIRKLATDIASRAVSSLEGAGLFAVELFLTVDDQRLSVVSAVVGNKTTVPNDCSSEEELSVSEAVGNGEKGEEEGGVVSLDDHKMTRICHKLIEVFMVDKPTATDWRRLLAFSREWDDIRPHFFKLCQDRADVEDFPGMKHKILRLGRKLKEIDEDVQRHNELLKVVRGAPSDISDIVARRRKDFTKEFFVHLHTVSESYYENLEEQNGAFGKLCYTCLAAVQAYDSATKSIEALNAAELKFQDIIDSPSVEAACRKIDNLTEKNQLDSTLVMMITKDEVKDVLYHLYVTAGGNFQKLMPKEIRIVKDLLNIDDPEERLSVLQDAFTPGEELEGKDVDNLYTKTPHDHTALQAPNTSVDRTGYKCTTTTVVTGWESSAFVSGYFIWLGRFHNEEAIVLYNGANDAVPVYLSVPPCAGLTCALETLAMAMQPCGEEMQAKHVSGLSTLKAGP
ncbi:hypothetical protein ACLB2K_046458 [Fragaria x ananassa]